jgi:hypothetical protein
LEDGNIRVHCEAIWAGVDDQTRKAWANDDDATRDGAYGAALAAIELSRGLVAVRRAETRTGVDYYLGYPYENTDDLEANARLEVSDTNKGDRTVMQTRLRQ